jgi:S-adenosylmethionine-diacylgycerolhomoserine-N-methlytransferase
MDGHLLPLLEEQFEPLRSSVKNAYLGIWEYLLFVGRKTN